jgi:hypothetical protein
MVVFLKTSELIQLNTKEGISVKILEVRPLPAIEIELTMCFRFCGFRGYFTDSFHCRLWLRLLETFTALKLVFSGGISSRLVSVPSDYQIVLIGTGKVDCFFWSQKSILTFVVKLRFRCSYRYGRQESINRNQPSYSLEEAETVCACACWGMLRYCQAPIGMI